MGKREEKYVWVRFKGAFYGLNTYCHTLKEAMETHKFKRNDIAEWWKNSVNYIPG